jgi:hypothetical protein
LEVLREQPVFENARKRVDLVLNADQAAASQILVEIKAESFQNRMDPFVTGTRDDYLKLDGERSADFRRSPCLVMSLPFNRESRDAVLGLTTSGGQPLFGQIYEGEVAICLAVYEASTGWQDPQVFMKADAEIAEGAAKVRR